MHSKIAIIGMSCYFPGALHYLDYWRELLDGNIAYKKNHNKTNDNYRPEKGTLEYADYFDPAKFNISEKEAEVMDPQTRKFIELTYQALEDANYPMGKGLNNVGVIASQGTNHTYHNELTKLLTQKKIPEINQLMENINKGADFLATRIAYAFNFTGPCFNLQSACSSSLVSVVEAIYMLESGRCDAVIAGGINISYPLESGYIYESGSIYSNSGICKPFDAKADGTIPSNGGGLVILKKLAQAELDGDRIHAIISGAAINNDGGQKVSYAAPSAKGQYLLLKNVYSNARIKPTSLKFIECHATGTVVGDPIETRAISQLLLEQKDTEQLSPLLLGSVKGSIGHLFWSSGIASLIKSILSLKYGIYPATANLTQQNPLLELSNTKIRLAHTNTKLDQAPIVSAGVSSFGVGGTNAHVVLIRYGDKYQEFIHSKKYSYFEKFPAAKKYSLIPDTLIENDNNAGILETGKINNIDKTLIELFEEALGEKNLSSNSNYFECYGDSISAITLITRIKSNFNIIISQQEIFDNPTPKELSKIIKEKISYSQPSLSDQTNALINHDEIGFNLYQKRFFLLEKLQRGNYSNYNVGLCLDIDNRFPKENFIELITHILETIPAFNQNISWSNGNIIFKGKRNNVIQVGTIEIPIESEIKPIIDSLFGNRFNLETGPSCHVNFLKHGSCEYLIINIPHLLIDGKGMDNLLKAISDTESKGVPLNTIEKYIPLKYSENLSETSRKFWRDKISNVNPTILVDTNKIENNNDYNKNNNSTSNQNDNQKIDYSKLQFICEKLKTTSFTLLYTFFNYYLFLKTKNSVICTGTTLINRDERSRDMIGCFINNIPIPVNCEGGDIFSILENTQKSISEGILHSAIPYDLIASDSQKSGTPLYSILFMLQNQNKGYELNINKKKYTESFIKYSPLYCDICVNVIPNKKDLYIDISYDKNKYSEAFISDLTKGYIDCISNCLNQLENEMYVN